MIKISILDKYTDEQRDLFLELYAKLLCKKCLASFVDPFIAYNSKRLPKKFEQTEEEATPEVLECMRIVDEKFGLN